METRKLTAILDAMVLSYGCVSLEKLNGLLRDHYATTCSLEDLKEALKESRLATFKADLLYHKRISDPMPLYQALRQITDLNHRHMPKEWVDHFSKAIPPSISIHHDRLRDFLVSHMKVDVIQANVMLEEMCIQFNLEWHPERILAYLMDKITFDDPWQVEGLKELMQLVYNHTPRWMNLGHTPHHLYEPKIEEKPESLEEKQPSKPQLQKNVGRNEPCPCGSGKKYKKCCHLKA